MSTSKSKSIAILTDQFLLDDFSRRPHRRALHFNANQGDIAVRPYFHAVREAAGPDDESDTENDYRVGSNQFRVHRQKFEHNYDDILS